MKYRSNNSPMQLAAFLCMLAGPISVSQAQHPTGLPNNYPIKPVTVLVGSSPGGAPDVQSRLILGKLGERWGNRFLVDNATIGTAVMLDRLSQRAADGYTLGMVNGATFVQAELVTKKPPNVMAAIEPLALFTATPFLMAVPASMPGNLRDYLAYVKKNPGKLNYYSVGVGSSAHLISEYIKLDQGLSMVHVPYKSAVMSLADLSEGRLHMVFATITSLEAALTRGSIRILAVTSRKRVADRPDTPALSEIIPDFEFETFYGIAAPAGVPKPIIAALNKGMNETMVEPDIRKRLTQSGSVVKPLTPEEFKKSVVDFVSRVSKLVKEANLDLGDGG